MQGFYRVSKKGYTVYTNNKVYKNLQYHQFVILTLTLTLQGVKLEKLPDNFKNTSEAEEVVFDKEYEVFLLDGLRDTAKRTLVLQGYDCLHFYHKAKNRKADDQPELSVFQPVILDIQFNYIREKLETEEILTISDYLNKYFEFRTADEYNMVDRFKLDEITLTKGHKLRPTKKFIHTVKKIVEGTYVYVPFKYTRNKNKVVFIYKGTTYRADLKTFVAFCLRHSIYLEESPDRFWGYALPLLYSEVLQWNKIMENKFELCKVENKITLTIRDVSTCISDVPIDQIRGV